MKFEPTSSVLCPRNLTTPDRLIIRKKEVDEAMKANISIPVQEIAYLPLKELRERTKDLDKGQKETVKRIREKIRNKQAAKKSRQKGQDYLSAMISTEWIRDNYLIPERELARVRNSALREQNSDMIDKCLRNQGMDPKEYTLKWEGQEIIAWKLNGGPEPEGTLRI